MERQMPFVKSFHLTPNQTMWASALVLILLVFCQPVWAAEAGESKEKARKPADVKEREAKKKGEDTETDKKKEKKEKKSTFMGMKKINEYLPEPWQKKLKVSLQMRHRFEYQENKNFNDGTLDKDGFQLLRTRLNIDFTPADFIRTFVQIQDSRIWDEDRNVISTGGLNGFEDSADIRQGYLDLIIGFGGDEKKKKNSLTFRIGRQELAYGKERLIGGFNWSNVAQTFDAGKVIFKMGQIQADLFVARKVVIDRNSWNDWDEHDTLSGLYLQFVPVRQHKIEAFYFFRDTDRNTNATQPIGAQLDVSTIGFRLSGNTIDKKAKQPGGLDYNLEFAYQFGSAGGATITRSDVSTMAVNLGLGYTLPVKYKPRFAVNIDYASGDERPTTGTFRTFDNLFPTNHGFYGIFDRVSLRNIFAVAFKFHFKPAKKLTVKIDLHLFFLATSRDNLYHAGRGTLRSGSTTPTSDFVGTELDLQFAYKFNRFAKLVGGFAHFWTGSFIRQTGADDHGEFFYLMTIFNF